MKRFLYCCLIISFLFVSCGKAPVNTVTDFKITGVEISLFLQSQEIIPNHPIFVDDKYSIPSKGWIENQFSSAFFSFKKQTLGNWASEENDCDDFARFAAFFAQYLHHNTKNKLKNTSLAFGEFAYIKLDGSGHAIDIFLYREAGQIKIGFFEPQTCQIIVLDKREYNNCIYVRF